MNRALQLINLFGVLALALLCVFQWQRDRRLNLEVNRLEKTRLANEQKIAEQQRSITGLNDDLNIFREQLTQAKTDLTETRHKLSTSESLNEQLTAERDQLRENIVVWTNAVAERDALLTEANDRIREVAERLNASVQKYNELATNYNSVVEALNATRAGQTNSTARSR